MRWLSLVFFSACTTEVESLLARVAPTPPPVLPTAPTCQAPVGRMPARRISKAEYNRTMASLFQGGSLDVGTIGANLPDDVPGTNGLAVSDAFLEAHETNAFELASRAVGTGAIANCSTQTGSAARSCISRTLKPFLERAWRRPVTTDEVEQLTAYIDVVAVEPTQPIHEALVLAMVHALMAPQFLFRFEPLPSPQSTTAQQVPAQALAVRLSYFLFGTGPDEQLQRAVDTGTLGDPAEQERQVDRMLADARSSYLIERLATRWLWADRVDVVNPSADRYPDVDLSLRQSLKSETQRLLQASLDSRTPAVDLLDAPSTFVNPRLAAHYGFRGVSGDGWQRVDLTRHPLRGGLLTHGSILAATSAPLNNPTAQIRETNVIIRGKFVLKQLACAEFETPSGIDFVAIQNQAQMTIAPDAPRKVREAVRQSRGECSSCHSILDPVGYSMESFDVVGAQRTVDTFGAAVDTTGILVDNDGSEVGQFRSARELGSLLKRDSRLGPCLARHLFSLAVERELHHEEACRATHIADRATAASGSLRDMILAVVRDDSFLLQEGEAP